MRRCVIRSYHICEEPEYVHEVRNDGESGKSLFSIHTEMMVDTWDDHELHMWSLASNVTFLAVSRLLAKGAMSSTFKPSLMATISRRNEATFLYLDFS
jgi:hypothetical protein